MKPLARANFRHFSVEMNRDEIDVSMMSPSKVPDPGWKYMDKQGHGHFWDGNDLPTLEWVITGTQWIGDEYDGEEHPVGEYRCRQCGEVIKPGKRLKYPDPVLGPMQVTITIDGEAFFLSESEYHESLDAWAAALQEIRDRNG